MITGNRQRKYLGRIPTTEMPNAAVKLGDAVREVLENRILPQQARFSSIIDIWQQLVPVELARHCRVVELTAGVLKVLVDSAVYKYELQLCSWQLLDDLRRQCPQARIRKIELAVG
jgi:hypothetical protein